MITKKTNVLGLIIPDNSNLFFADLSKAIEIAARHAGYNLIYGNSNNNSKRDIEYMKMFVDRRVDGIIYAKSTTLNCENDRDCIRFIQKATTPIIAVDRVVEDSSVSSIVLDHFQGGISRGPPPASIGAYAHWLLYRPSQPEFLTRAPQRL